MVRVLVKVYQTAILLLVLGVAAAAAQATTGDISGTVRDPSKAVLPGATVEVKNLETGASRTIVTDSEGRYRALNLPPGRYAIISADFGLGIQQGERRRSRRPDRPRPDSRSESRGRSGL